MADEEAVKRLKWSVAEWNAWREANLIREEQIIRNRGGLIVSRGYLSNVNLDRSGARRGSVNLSVNLSGADLQGAALIGADLRYADLRGANLQGADLVGANLLGADLRGAHLNVANLYFANLYDANLAGANLVRAHLTGANVVAANLSRANLSDAFLFETIFSNVDLSSVIGLETCIHQGSSIIDHQTLQKSGPLPLPFLRGVGLPDTLIEYLPSLFNQAVQFYSCFISYRAKGEDEEFAKRLYADLQDRGVRCWFDKHDLPIGAKIWDAIDEAIKLRDKLLLILSENSIQSDWKFTFDVFVPAAVSGGPLGQPWYLTFGKTNSSTLNYGP